MVGERIEYTNVYRWFYIGYASFVRNVTIFLLQFKCCSKFPIVVAEDVISYPLPIEEFCHRL